MKPSSPHQADNIKKPLTPQNGPNQPQRDEKGNPEAENGHENSRHCYEHIDSKTS